MSTEIIDLGLLDYRAAWDRQLQFHDQVLADPAHPGFLLLVEHPPVVTIGRHPGSANHLLVTPELLKLRGVEVAETDRGGDITFHGPGQLVAYPIIPLNYYHLNLHAYMRLLEQVVINTIARFNLIGHRDPTATGVWIHPLDPAAPRPFDPARAAKICAMGVKLRRWVTLHGLALNVTTDLSYFALINPCGLSRPVTSLQKLLAPTACPTMATAKTTLAEVFKAQLAEDHGLRLSKLSE